MHINYLIARENISSLKKELEKLIDSAPSNTFEDRKGSLALENAIKSLDSCTKSIDRFSAPTIEGKLKEYANTQKFELIKNDGQGVGWLFGCSSLLEVYSDKYEDWFAGSVENNGNSYYFKSISLENPMLYTGMKARIRIT